MMTLEGIFAILRYRTEPECPGRKYRWRLLIKVLFHIIIL